MVYLLVYIVYSLRVHAFTVTHFVPLHSVYVSHYAITGFSAVWFFRFAAIHPVSVSFLPCCFLASRGLFFSAHCWFVHRFALNFSQFSFTHAGLGCLHTSLFTFTFFARNNVTVRFTHTCAVHTDPPFAFCLTDPAVLPRLLVGYYPHYTTRSHVCYRSLPGSFYLRIRFARFLLPHTAFAARSVRWVYLVGFCTPQFTAFTRLPAAFRFFPHTRYLVAALFSRGFSRCYACPHPFIRFSFVRYTPPPRSGSLPLPFALRFTFTTVSFTVCFKFGSFVRLQTRSLWLRLPFTGYTFAGFSLDLYRLLQVTHRSWLVHVLLHVTTLRLPFAVGCCLPLRSVTGLIPFVFYLVRVPFRLRLRLHVHTALGYTPPPARCHGAAALTPLLPHTFTARALPVYVHAPPLPLRSRLRYLVRASVCCHIGSAGSVSHAFALSLRVPLPHGSHRLVAFLRYVRWTRGYVFCGFAYSFGLVPVHGYSVYLHFASCHILVAVTLSFLTGFAGFTWFVWFLVHGSRTVTHLRFSDSITHRLRDIANLHYARFVTPCLRFAFIYIFYTTRFAHGLTGCYFLHLFRFLYTHVHSRLLCCVAFTQFVYHRLISTHVHVHSRYTTLPHVCVLHWFSRSVALSGLLWFAVCGSRSAVLLWFTRFLLH